MQKVKYNVPIPKWFVGVLIVILLIVALGILAYFDVAGIGSGMLIAAEYIVMGVFMWGGVSWLNGITLWIVLAVGFGIVYILIAKRRYLKTHEAYVQAQPGYVPRGSELSSAALPTASPAATAAAIEQTEKKEETA